MSRSRLLLLHTPHPGTFCAGADLRERRTMSPGQVSDFLDSLRCLISELEAMKVPSVGVVDGYALGGGTEIALGCDLRVGGMSSLRRSTLRALSCYVQGRWLMYRARNCNVITRGQTWYHPRCGRYTTPNEAGGYGKSQGVDIYWKEGERGGSGTYR